jgi:hypothetical protein
MKPIKILLILTWAVMSAYAPGQNMQLSINSIFSNALESFYENALEGKDSIWPNMELAPVCIFRLNGPAFLYNHPNPPESFERITERLYMGTQEALQLSGVTQAEINNQLTAILDYGSDFYLTTDEAFAELFHELHHVFQRNHIEHLEHDNPAVLLTYPEDITNDGMKLFEQMLLYNLCFANNEADFKWLLNHFYSCRCKREVILGEYADYEKKVENMEGPAFYCEYQYYNKYANCMAKQKENYIQKHFFGILTTPYYGRTNLRLRHLASGMAMCYLLDKYHPGWKDEYYGNSHNLYDYFISRFNPQLIDLPNLDVYYALSSYHTPQETSQHELNYERFNAQPGLKVVLDFNTVPQFRGFDPMHAESINDSIILHRTLLNLSNNDNQLFITNKEAITFIQEQVWFVRKVLFYLEDKSELENVDGKFVISTDNIKMEWTGRSDIEQDNNIVIRCE